MIRPDTLSAEWVAPARACSASMSLRCHCRELVEVETGRAPVTCACGCRYTLRPAEAHYGVMLSIESHDGARFDVTIGRRGELVPGAPVGLAPDVVSLRRDFPG